MAYAEYIKLTLRVGMVVTAVSGDRMGDTGKYLGMRGGKLLCHVTWNFYGRDWWVEWYDIEIAAVEAVVGNHEMKAVSGNRDIKCILCSVGSSSQTGTFHYCDCCHICELCCESAPDCSWLRREAVSGFPEAPAVKVYAVQLRDRHFRYT